MPNMVPLSQVQDVVPAEVAAVLPDPNGARRMTRAEVDKELQGVNDDLTSIRHRLLRLYQGRAHLAYGYESFQTFVRQELQAVSLRHVWRQIAWAQAERDVFGEESTRALLQREATELLRLPAPERAPAWTEAKTITAHNPLRDLKHIVNRRLGVSDSYAHPKVTREAEPEEPSDEATFEPEPELTEDEQDALLEGMTVHSAETIAMDLDEDDEDLGSTLRDVPLWMDTLHTVRGWLASGEPSAYRATREAAAERLREIASWLTNAR